MSADYARNHCKIALAKIMQTMGWNSINSTPLEVLTDVMVEYINQISKLTVDYAQEFGRTEPNLDHLGLAFQEMGVNLPEIEEYVTFVNFLPSPAPVPKFPLPKDTNLNFLKPGSKEFVTRPVHINEHLPPMYPLLEEQDQEMLAEVKKEEPSDEVPNGTEDTFKKPAEVGVMTPEFKRSRKESEGSRPTREISSVMMTTSGFLSPAREGRLPEAKAPLPPPEPPKPPTPEPVVVVPPPPSEPPPLAVIVPQKKPKPEKKEKKLHKELFKPIDQDGKVLKKLPEAMKEVLKMKQVKAAATAALLSGIPGIHPLHTLSNAQPIPNIVKSELRMPFPGHIPTKAEINKTVFNKTLAAAKAKTEKLNTTITPIPTVKNEIPFHFPQHLQVDKLVNQPDKKKINILRKISNKPKQPPPVQMPHMNDPSDIVNKINLSSDITIEPINPGKMKPKMEPYFDGSGLPLTSRPDMLKLNPVAKERKRKEKPEKPPKVPKPKRPRKTPHEFFSPDMVNLRMERPRHGPESHFLGGGLSQFPPLSNLGNPLPFSFPMGGPGLIPTPLAPNLFSFSSQIASFGKNPLFQNLVPPLEVPGPKMGPKPPKQRVKKEPKEPKAPKEPKEPKIPKEPKEPKIPKEPKEPKVPKQEIIVKEELPIKEEPVVGVLPISNTPGPEKVVEKIKSPKNEPMDLTTEAVPPPAAEIVKKIKEHKKEKRDKIRKKKDKKDKNKLKAEKALEKAGKKAEKKEEKKKLKKEEREKLKKEKKLKKEIKEIKEEPKELKEPEIPIPKILLKVNSPSPRPETPETMKKLNIKPIVKKEEEPSASNSSDKKQREPSPGLAKISALVTGPPKHKKEEDEKPAAKPAAPLHTPRPPGRPRIHPVKPKPSPKPKKQEVPFVRMDSDGNEIWICPSCGQQDDGRPMIGCDGCDAWYHWVCVGIQVPPDENENWYCKPCLAKKNEDLQDKKRKRKRKERKDH